LKTLLKGIHGPDELELVAGKVADAIRPVRPFCLWLKGPLGAGKTTLTGQLLRHLGLPKTVPVTSPTYTYMNDYQIGDEWYAHLDLYRSRGALSSEDLGLADARPFNGIFVEWPEESPNDPYLQPTHVLEIAFVQGGAAREYRLSEA